MTIPEDPVPAGGWRCRRCGSVRPATDGFCGLCGARMPRNPEALVGPGVGGPADETAGGPEEPAEERPRPGWLRPLVLSGIPLVGVAIALLVGRPAGDGPAVIASNPGIWRCGNGNPTWSTPIRAVGDTIVVEWRSGGADGTPAAAEEVGRYTLDAYRQGDGTYVIPASDLAITADAACTLPAGPYSLVVIDNVIDEVVAAGPVTLER